MKNFKFEPSYYRILCVDEKATDALIKKCYIGQTKIYHPDKNPDKLDWAHEKTVELNLAYQVLSNPILRAQYDSLYANYLKDKKKQEEEKLRTKKEEPPKSAPKKQAGFKMKETELTEGQQVTMEFLKAMQSFIKYYNERKK